MKYADDLSRTSSALAAEGRGGNRGRKVKEEEHIAHHFQPYGLLLSVTSKADF